MSVSLPQNPKPFMSDLPVKLRKYCIYIYKILITAPVLTQSLISSLVNPEIIEGIKSQGAIPKIMKKIQAFYHTHQLFFRYLLFTKYLKVLKYTRGPFRVQKHAASL